MVAAELEFQSKAFQHIDSNLLQIIVYVLIIRILHD